MQAVSIIRGALFRRRAYSSNISNFLRPGEAYSL